MNTMAVGLGASVAPRIIDSIQVGSTAFFVTRYGLGYAVIREQKGSRSILHEAYSRSVCIAVMEDYAQDERENWGEL